MRKSMTAYGRGLLETSFGRWTMEISSVNRKGLELYLHLPPQLLFLDPIIRKWVGKVAQRGSVQIRLACEMKEVEHLVALLKNEKSRWEKVAEALEIPSSEMTLSFLLEHATLAQASLDPTQAEKEAFLVWEKSSKAWTAMKLQEGRTLAQDIQMRVKTLQEEIKVIEKDLPKLAEAHLAKMLERLKQFELDPEALKKEAILQASRDDVTEEVIRLKSHLDQMTEYLSSEEESVGRTLDFLAQEMGREVGTLMAKAGSSEIAKRAVHMKSEVEKIREQVQNIE
jgi:uncharacterized protein (TIGR00255 family)